MVQMLAWIRGVGLRDGCLAETADSKPCCAPLQAANGLSRDRREMLTSVEARLFLALAIAQHLQLTTDKSALPPLEK
jgi:hypothetical protein